MFFSSVTEAKGVRYNFQYCTECTDSLSHCPFNKSGLLTRQQHNIWYCVMCWRKATSFSCVLAVAISGAALQLDGNQTDSFTLKGQLHKVTT